MTYTYNLRTWELRQKDCHEFQASLKYRVRPVSEKEEKEKRGEEGGEEKG